MIKIWFKNIQFEPCFDYVHKNCFKIELDCHWNFQNWFKNIKFEPVVDYDNKIDLKVLN